MTLDALGTILVSGLLVGSIYALMTSGLSLIWTTLRIFNFAHGALMTLAAYVAWTVADAAGLGLGPYAGVLCAIFAAACAGVLMERTVVRPFYDRKNMVLITVMTTLAVMIFIERGIQMVWGARLKQLPPLVGGRVEILGTVIAAQELLIILVAPVVLVALWLFLDRTRVGRSIRAVGQNAEAAQLIGINVSLVYLIAFAIAAALAGLTGTLLGSIRLVTPGFGAEPLVKSLIIVIFGGLGSLSGTIVAAYIIGLLEAVLIFAIGIYWAPSALFVLLVLVLMFRPQGLFGKTVR